VLIDSRFSKAMVLFARHNGTVAIGDLEEALRPLSTQDLIDHLCEHKPNARIDIAHGRATFVTDEFDVRFGKAFLLFLHQGTVPIAELDRALRPLSLHHLVVYLHEIHPNARIEIADGNATYIGWVPELSGPLLPE
jgi:hypothetical protein